MCFLREWEKVDFVKNGSFLDKLGKYSLLLMISTKRGFSVLITVLAIWGIWGVFSRNPKTLQEEVKLWILVSSEKSNPPSQMQVVGMGVEKGCQYLWYKKLYFAENTISSIFSKTQPLQKQGCKLNKKGNFTTNVGCCSRCKRAIVLLSILMVCASAVVYLAQLQVC